MIQFLRKVVRRVCNIVLIGANAAVLCDVPDGCVAVGVPATVRPRRESKP